VFRFRITVSRRGRRLSPEWVCRRRFAAAQARTIAPKSSGSGPGREPQVTHYEHVRNLANHRGQIAKYRRVLNHHFVASTVGATAAINCSTNLPHAGRIGLPKNCSLKARKKDEDINTYAANCESTRGSMRPSPCSAAM
jgi:hypothetical protein